MFPKNTVNGGQYATNKITIAPVMKKGTKSFTHSSIEIPAILQDIKSVVPTGGVNNPIAREQSTTMDMWTSNQNKGYMCVTVHWIDDEWIILKRIIKFMHVEGRHTGLNMFGEFIACILRWFIEKKCFLLLWTMHLQMKFVLNMSLVN